MTKRIVQGVYVIDQNQFSRGDRESYVVAIYRVKGDKIVESWLTR